MTVYKRGSSGEDVKQIQQSLNNLGYNVGTPDGVYGEYTEKAVKKFQKDNGGTGDGIVGDWTLNKLGMSKVSNNAPMFAPNTSAAYTTAMSTLNKVNKSKPTYNDAYGGQLKDLYEQIVGRDKFSYDINADALYKQYAQQYADMGRMAMKDTMGQAAGLTGGYGSSYAESVGQQQYDAYLQRLNDVVPELEERAYGRWQDEGNALMQQYSMLGDLSDRDYGRYQDQLNLWLNEKQLAQGAADTAWDRSWNEWQTKLNQLNNEEQLKLQKEATKKAGSSGGSRRYSSDRDTTPTSSKITPEVQWAVVNAANNALASTGGPLYDTSELEIPDNATIVGQTATGSIIIDGRGGRWSKQEVQKFIDNGNVRVEYNPKTNSVTYKWVGYKKK